MQIGDTIFLNDGVPAVIIDKKANGEVVAEREGENFENVRNTGFINGLVPSDKKEFSNIVSQIRQIKDPKQKYEALIGKIDELKEKNSQLLSMMNDKSLDETSLERYKQQERSNANVVKYLKAELFHLLSSENIRPKVYNLDPTML